MNRIKKVLEQIEIKQTWLAEKLGNNYNMVNFCVKNRQQPRLEVLPEIAAILDIDIKELTADVHELEIRSYNMSQIKGKNTKPEIMVRKFLHAHSFRYRLQDKKLPGTPDIILPKYNAVIVVHGCFWHGHESYKHYVIPKTRTEWWLGKINTNKFKDEENETKIKTLEWKMITVLEWGLRSDKRDKTSANLLELFRNNHIKTFHNETAFEDQNITHRKKPEIAISEQL